MCVSVHVCVRECGVVVMLVYVCMYVVLMMLGSGLVNVLFRISRIHPMGSHLSALSTPAEQLISHTPHSHPVGDNTVKLFVV